MRTVLLTCFLAFTSVACQSDSPTGWAPTEEPEVTSPPLGEPTVLEPGVRFHEVTLRRGDTPMKVWIYLPEEMPEGKIPCILIAPAGSALIFGMALAEGDRPEHLPYVREGYAVVSYELDGPVPSEEDAPSDATFSAAGKFRDSNAGLSNAKAALDYALDKVPAIDPDRIYAVGHSSAATHALLVASQEPRIDACIAFAPVTNVPRFLPPGLSRLMAMAEVPGFEEFLGWSSPHTHAAELKCPVLLFHARDDSVVEIRESTEFAETLKQTNPRVTLIEVPTGDHYNSMIRPGIPRAIEWLKGLSE